MDDAAELLNLMPFAGKLGIELELATAARVAGSLPWAADLCTSGGILHGGALMALADTLGGVCAYLNLPTDATTATLASTTNMIRAVRDGRVIGESRPVHVGRTTIVVQTELRDLSDRLVAQVTQTQAVLATRRTARHPAG